MPLAGAAENDIGTDLNSTVSNNAITNQSLEGMNNKEIAKLQEWLNEKKFKTSVNDNSLSITNLTIGATGENVVALQKWLKEHGFYTGEIDGQFGNTTEKAVKRFQNASGIVEDGWVGIQTLQAMEQWNQNAGKENSNDTENTSNDNTSSSKANYSTSTKQNTHKYRSTYKYRSTGSYSGGRGTGDCWDNSAILYNKLTSSGTKSRIIQYGTSLSPRHRSVQIYQNGGWADYNYKSNGYAKRYYATKKKPGMKVVK